MSGWVIVKFKEESKPVTEVVPRRWQTSINNETYVYWPPATMPNKKINEQIENNMPAKSNWKIYLVEVLSKKVYLTYKEADANLNKYISYEKETFSSNEETCASDSLQHSPSSDAFSDDLLDLPRVPLLSKSSVITNSPGINVQEPTNSLEEHYEISDTTLINNVGNFSVDAIIFEDFKKEVFRQLHLINCRLRDQSEMLNQIMQNQISNNQHCQESIMVENSNEVPVKSLEELESLEKKLEDNGFYGIFIKDIARVGGVHIKEFVKRALTKIMNDEVASLYSWVGGKGKKKFVLLKASKAIKDASKLNGTTRNATEKEIEQAIAIWLTKAPSRLAKATNEKVSEEAV